MVYESNRLSEDNAGLLTQITDLSFEVKDVLARWMSYLEQKQELVENWHNASMQKQITVHKQFIEDM